MNAETLPPILPGCGACGSLQIRPVVQMLTEEQAKAESHGLVWSSRCARIYTEYFCRKCGHNRTSEWENLYGST